ncbi:MAG: DUF420 domain-containing protein [Chlorobiota bacterium]
MAVIELLPTINAALNGTAAICLLLGRWAIARRQVVYHRALMVAAFVVSILFLASYLVYHFSTHVITPFGGTGLWRTVYYSVLISHSVLAASVPALAIITLWRAVRNDLRRHRAIARWTFPIWLYVSVTGVLIYLMLYHFFPASA